jgi:GT2 family glycosyltransferase
MVSIVIPVVDNWDLTKACLAALRRSTKTSVEVIVVDNGSKKRTAQALRESRHIDKLIRNERNVGFGKAVNQGWCNAKGDYLCTINNDTIPGDGWLESLVETAKRPDVGVTGKFGGYCKSDWTNAGMARWPGDADYIEGSCLLMRRDVYDQVGGFDDAYAPAYCEDTDLSQRVKLLGLRAYCRPDVDFEHLGGQTSKDVMPDFNAVLSHNLRLMKLRYGTCISAALTNPPVSLVFVGDYAPPPYYYYMDSGHFGIMKPVVVNFDGVIVAHNPNIAEAPAPWVLLIKDGEKPTQDFMRALPALVNTDVEAWQMSTPCGKQVRLFRHEVVEWDADNLVVTNTESGQARVLNVEAIVNA